MGRECRARLERRGQGPRSPKGRERNWQGSPALRQCLLTLPVVLMGLSGPPSIAFAQSRALAEAPGAQLVDQPTPDSEPRVTLLIYNYAHLDSASLAGTQQVVAAIFEGAGVETDWIDCPLSPVDFEKYPACQRPARTTDFVVRLMTASMAAKLPMADGPLGFAQRCPDVERACVANIFYARVDELAARSDARTPRILAHAIAHEVGHLLLGPNAHSPRGLMRGVWSREDLKLMCWSHLLFTPQQSGQIRDSLVRRARL